MSSLARALNRPVVAIVAVGIIAAALRFTHLSYPPERVFDEVYYTKSACIFLGYPNDRCDVKTADEKAFREQRNDTAAWVHPPLGKWAIALGELSAGTDTFGSRISAAMAGTATVILLALIAQLLFRSPIWTFTGGLLLAVENLNFVLSRTGMLDIFVTFWIVLGLLFMLFDRRWIERRTPEPPPGDVPADDAVRPRLPSPLWRPWRFAAGVALGAGLATKWSALTGIAAAIFLAYMWEASRQRRYRLPRPLRRTVSIETLGVVLAFVVVPASIYVVSYVPWFLHFGWNLNTWATMQRLMFDFQAGLRSTEEPNLDKSAAWQWLLLWRPVVFYGVSGSGMNRFIYANGNPAIFWGSFVAVPYAAFSWTRRHDWLAGFIVVTVLALYLPWFLSSHPGFLFYAGPLTPFLVLACVYGLRSLSEYTTTTEAGKPIHPLRPVAVLFVAIAAGLFVFFWPTLTGGPLSDHALRLRTWFTSWR
jgi:dolichyl-phosphate-mannose-protein mannosyltransferase